MRNINELIGIVFGIDFDGVINSKEVIRLQTWVDQNRNLVVDSQQIRLVQIVDSALEDGIITEDEKHHLLDYCEIFLHQNTDTNAKLYELGGIIDGIICDNVVNEKEVYGLKNWMVANAAIKGNQAYDSLCTIVDDILEDGIVTSDEQEKLLQIITKKINNSKFQAKMKHLRKMVKSRKNIGIDLIDLLDNETAMETIHMLAESQLNRTLASYTGSYVADPEVVFVSLVLIGMLTYDGNFYSNVEGTYKSLYRSFSEQKIEGMIRNILGRYRTDKEVKASRTRIINVVLYNAIVPSHFLSAFFEFIYDIYKLNFEYSLSDDIYADFKFVYEGLHSSMLSEGDDVKLTVTKKTYKLIKSTKKIIADNQQMDAIIKLSIIVVKLIDKMIWSQEIKIYNSYLKSGFDSWVKTIKESTEEGRKRKSCSELRSRWEPKYILSDNKIYIIPPLHRIKSDYDYRYVRVEIKNGNKLVYSDCDPDIREIIGGYQVSIGGVCVDDPLGHINYRLMSSDDVIYDSKDKLYRQLIVFDAKGNEISNNTDYSGTAVFCCRKENQHIKPFVIRDYYQLFSLNVHLGDVLEMGDMMFNFSSLNKPGIFGEEYKAHFIVDEVNQQKIKVYKQVQFLVFECENTTKNFEIDICGRAYKLSSLDHTVSKKNGINKYVVNIEIDNPGIYTIAVYKILEGRKIKIASFDLALDPELDVDELKLDEENYMVAVKSAFLPKAINVDIKVSDFEEDWLHIDYQGKSYYYCIPFKFDIYKISGLSWKPMNSELWIEDITQESLLNLYGNEVNGMTVFSPLKEELTEVIALKDRGFYQQIDIGFLMSYKNIYNSIILVFSQDGEQKKKLICFNRCILNESETELVFDPVKKLLTAKCIYYGRGNVGLKICDSDGDIIYSSNYLKSGDLIEVEDLDSFKPYSIRFYEKEKGLSFKKERLLKEFKKTFYAWYDFVGRSFKIDKVYFDQCIKGKLSRKSHYFNRIYVIFNSKEKEDLYTGEVYVKTNKSNLFLDEINPVLIEICSEVIDDVLELSITKDGDGLFLDFEKHGIKNILVDNLATDIFSYMIDVNGVKISG